MCDYIVLFKVPFMDWQYFSLAFQFLPTFSHTFVLTSETASEEDIQNAIDETNKRPMTEEEKREQVKRSELTATFQGCPTPPHSKNMKFYIYSFNVSPLAFRVNIQKEKRILFPCYCTSF